MTQLKLNETSGAPQANGVQKVNNSQPSAVLHRHLHHEFLDVARGEGHYLILEDGRKIFDASGGAAVACIGVSDLFLEGPGGIVKCYSGLALTSSDGCLLTWHHSMAMPE